MLELCFETKNNLYLMGAVFQEKSSIKFEGVNISD